MMPTVYLVGTADVIILTAEVWYNLLVLVDFTSVCCIMLSGFLDLNLHDEGWLSTLFNNSTWFTLTHIDSMGLPSVKQVFVSAPLTYCNCTVIWDQCTLLTAVVVWMAQYIICHLLSLSQSRLLTSNFLHGQKYIIPCSHTVSSTAELKLQRNEPAFGLWLSFSSFCLSGVSVTELLQCFLVNSWSVFFMWKSRSLIDLGLLRDRLES